MDLLWSMKEEEKYFMYKYYKPSMACYKHHYYEKFHGELEQEGFEFNPYNPCVANRVKKGHNRWSDSMWMI